MAARTSQLKRNPIFGQSLGNPAADFEATRCTSGCHSSWNENLIISLPNNVAKPLQLLRSVKLYNSLAVRFANWISLRELFALESNDNTT